MKTKKVRIKTKTIDGPLFVGATLLLGFSVFWFVYATTFKNSYGISYLDCPSAVLALFAWFLLRESVVVGKETIKEYEVVTA